MGVSEITKEFPIRYKDYYIRALEVSDVDEYIELFKQGDGGFVIELNKEQAMRSWLLSVCDNIKFGSIRKEIEFRTVIENKVGEVVGGISILEVSSNVYELGYFVIRKYRGNGIASEVIKYLADNILNLHKGCKLVLKIRKDNIASKHVAVNAKFEFIISDSEKRLDIYERIS